MSTVLGSQRILYVLNEASYFLSHRWQLAAAARDEGFDIHVVAPPSPIAADIEARGVGFHPVPLSRRGMHPWQEARTLLALRRLYLDLRPSLVHHLTPKPVIYGGIAARSAKVPAVVSAITGTGLAAGGARGLRGMLLPRIARSGYRFALKHPRARVIFQNPDDQASFVNAGIVPPERAVLIRGSGVDLDAFAPAGEPEDPPLVVLASRLIWPKGVGEFVTASRLVRSEHPHARFVLVGDTDEGNPEGVPPSQIEVWVREGAIEHWGFQKDMRSVFSRASIVALPSTYGEGVPKVLIEAAACGRPIVTTDAPGCREIVRHDVNGLLVPPQSPTALASAIGTLLKNADRRREMGAAGRKIVVDEFDVRSVVERTLRVYRTLLGRK